MAPAIIVFPDCFTALGGNQYVNSSAVGPYADYLIREIIPFVDREFRTSASREYRGCFGKSSGGYGAIIHGMKYTSTWGAIADHSGDAYFEYVYWCDWPNNLNELAKFRSRPLRSGRYDVLKTQRGADRGFDDGRVARFLAAVWKKPKLSSAEGHALMNLCMAATYDPDPKAPNGFRLPFNLETGEVLPERWKVWQRHDPIHLGAAGALRWTGAGSGRGGDLRRGLLRGDLAHARDGNPHGAGRGAPRCAGDGAAASGGAGWRGAGGRPRGILCVDPFPLDPAVRGTHDGSCDPGHHSRAAGRGRVGGELSAGPARR